MTTFEIGLDTKDVVGYWNWIFFFAIEPSLYKYIHAYCKKVTKVVVNTFRTCLEEYQEEEIALCSLLHMYMYVLCNKRRRSPYAHCPTLKIYYIGVP